MSLTEQSVEKQFRTLKVVTWAFLVASPVVYLLVGNLVGRTIGAPAGNELVVYLLFAIGLVQPAFGWVIARIQVQAYRARPQTDMQPVNLFFTLSLIKMALVEAIYVYGLVSLFISGEFLNMLFFYPVGVAWSLVHWPTREKYNRLVESLGHP